MVPHTELPTYTAVHTCVDPPRVRLSTVKTTTSCPEVVAQLPAAARIDSTVVMNLKGQIRLYLYTTSQFKIRVEKKC